ncbi:MAG: chemotaxis protein CheB, partial [Bacteroidota bacterium]|nr:chemotaxis protein CheB [Bacteroidota bacterium]
MPAIKNNKDQPLKTEQHFPIIGVGASAGGLDAFKKLIRAIPEESGMAYVLVQHLDPQHESMLPQILERETKIPVHEIRDNIPLAPNHIYIIPENKILTSTDGVLKLTVRDLKIKNLPIDIFFTSLAEVHGNYAVGVVLTGTASDGTEGLKAIKANGGITIAQDPQSATYAAMPQSAINAGVVDFILTPEKIASQLAEIIKSYNNNSPHTDGELLSRDD